MAGDTLYELLDIRPDATTAEIRSAYLNLSKTYHPDSGGTAAFFRQLQQAYEVLSDTGRRAEYDASLRRGTGSVRDPESASHAGAWQPPGPGSHPVERPRPPHDQPPSPPSSSPRSFDFRSIWRRWWFWGSGLAVVVIAVFVGVNLSSTSGHVAASSSTTNTEPNTTSNSTDLLTVTGYGATIAAWNAHHRRDSAYDGLPAYGPRISTPQGPRPRYFDVQNDGQHITQFTEVLPGGTSLITAKTEVLRNLPSDAVPRALDISGSNGSCAFWNLTSATVGPVVIEMAYEDENGISSWRPNNVNTLSYKMGSSDSRIAC